MPCRLCDISNNFGKSHVIPEAFFRARHADAGPKYMVADGQYPKKAPVGVYDSAILCQGCERKFGWLDDYGAEVLINRFDELFVPVREQNSIVARRSVPGKVDQERLLRFFVSVLWRASISTNSYYRRVRLGPYESLAAKAVDPDVALDSAFAVALSCWGREKDDDAHILSRTNMDPFAEKWDGVNSYRFYFGDVVAYIKVDRRPFPRELDAIILERSDSVLMIEREFMSSNDLVAMQATMKKAKIPTGRKSLFEKKTG